jgi:translation elongation factor EF-Ts
MIQDNGDCASHEVKAFVTAVRALSEYTGLGVRDCRRALAACDDDPLVACGYLHYSGCLVNLNGQDREAWTLNRAREYAQLLELTDEGKIAQRAEPLKPRGPRLG